MTTAVTEVPGMIFERVQQKNGVSEWMILDWDGQPAAPFAAKTGDLVSAFAPDGSLTVGVVDDSRGVVFSTIAN